MMKREQRIDFLKTKVIKNKDENGFAVLEARPTGVGILKYKRTDGTIVRELRHPDEVFKKESMDTLSLKPFSLQHNGRHLNAKTAKRFMHGTTGEVIRQDGDFLACKIAVFDQKALDDIEDGDAIQLSPGYSCRLDKTPGNWRGERYDQQQIDIVYNHVSGVEKARKKGASFRLDSSDGDLTLISGFEEEEKQKMAKKILEAVEAGGLRFDSIEIEDTPENNVLLKQRNAAIASVNSLVSESSEKQGRLDAAEKDLESEKESKKDLIPADRLDSIVSDREVVIKLLKADGKELPKADSYEESTRLGKIALLGEKDERYDSDDAYLNGAWTFYTNDVAQREKELLSKRNLRDHRRTDGAQADNGKDQSQGV